MKSFFVTLIALGGLLSSSIASPVASPVDVSKRQEAAAIGYLNNLYASVQTYTAEMNAIISTVTVASSQADKDAATAAIGAQIQGLTSAVTSTTANVKTLTPVKRSVEARQTPADITAILVAVLNQVFGALTNIVAILGLTGLLSFLNPLLVALGGLILALEVVVDQLLIVVRELLDGLLTGLGLGLIGLGL